MNSGRVEHKTKMITVRLSEVEFDFLKTQYQCYGARNVSDLARLAVQRMMQAPNDMAATITTVADSVSMLRSRVSALEDEMTVFRDRVVTRTGPPQENQEEM